MAPIHGSSWDCEALIYTAVWQVPSCSTSVEKNFAQYDAICTSLRAYIKHTECYCRYWYITSHAVLYCLTFNMRLLAPSLLFSAAVALPLVDRAAKPIYWLLAGDSTTAPDGGWGDGFLSTTVASGSTGHNYGHSGATTASFRAGGDWGKIIKDIGTYKSKYDVYTTIQVNGLQAQSQQILTRTVRPQRPKGNFRRHSRPI